MAGVTVAMPIDPKSEKILSSGTFNTNSGAFEPIHELKLDHQKLFKRLQQINLLPHLPRIKNYTSKNNVNISIKQFSHGQSNPTYLIEFPQSSTKYVLRKMPPGKLLKGAHRVDREAKVMSALYKSINYDVKIPEILDICEDSSILGTPFYICEHVSGIIHRDPQMHNIQPQERAKAYHEMFRMLANIHCSSINSLGLDKFGHKDNCNSRQLKIWNKQYQIGIRICPSASVIEVENLHKWLNNHIPLCDKSGSYFGGSGATLIHGDYRMDNIIFNSIHSSEILAVLDWELSTIGDPMADLAYACLTHYLPYKGFLKQFALIKGPYQPESSGNSQIDIEGIPSVATMRASYFQTVNNLGKSVPEPSKVDWIFYVCLGLYRMACIASGVYIRSKSGQASQGSKAAAYGDAVLLLAKRALEIIATVENSNSYISNTVIKTSSNVVGYVASERCKKVLHQLKQFNDELVIPKEREMQAYYYSDKRWNEDKNSPILRATAKKKGLWNLFIPPTMLENLKNEHPSWTWNEMVPHDPAFSNLDYAHLAIESGRSLYCASLINCAAPDTGNMEILAKVGSALQREKYLKNLLLSRTRSCFGMTEPGISSSDPTQLSATATQQNDGSYIINGNKWWTTGAMHPNCDVCLFIARTEDDTKPMHKRHSLFAVPMTSNGIIVQRSLTVFGYEDAPGGHVLVEFRNVRVSSDALLGKRGEAFKYAQLRLGPGRLHHCARLIGMGERALEMTVERGSLRTAFGRPLLQLGGNSERLARCRIALRSARSSVLEAAAAIDTDISNGLQEGRMSSDCRLALAICKVLVPENMSMVLDFAVQIHGGGGLSADSPLASMWAACRTLRLVDGPDEVHLRSIAKIEVKRQIQSSKVLKNTIRDQGEDKMKMPGVGRPRL